jgi:group II intron reverse transcriptase/maturase
VAKSTTLAEAYRQAKRNGGAPGLDGQTFAALEAGGVAGFLATIQADLLAGTYQPQPHRAVDIPKKNGKVRRLQIPCIRDRVVQGALKLILEAIFEADFCPNSSGYRPRRSPHRALAEVRRSVLRRMTTVIEADFTSYFDTIQHARLLQQIARRVQDPAVLHLVKQVLKAGGKRGVPQGGPFSPLAANIYLTGCEFCGAWTRRVSAQGTGPSISREWYAEKNA